MSVRIRVRNINLHHLHQNLQVREPAAYPRGLKPAVHPVIFNGGQDRQTLQVLMPIEQRTDESVALAKSHLLLPRNEQLVKETRGIDSVASQDSTPSNFALSDV